MDLKLTPVDMNDAALARLKVILKRKPVTFEFGISGNTVLVAKGSKKSTHVDHREGWVMYADDAYPYKKADFELVSPFNLAGGLGKKAESIDLIIVNCLREHRVEAIASALWLLKMGGTLVLCDMNYDEVANAANAGLFGEWLRVDTEGTKTHWRTGKEIWDKTTFLTKPLEWAGADLDA